MSTHHPINGPAVIEQAWPYDGPHTVDTVREAAAAIAHLTRYLNNALYQRYVIGGGADLGAVLARLAETPLPALMQQLTRAAVRVTYDPTLFDDRRDRPGADTATEIALVLDQEAHYVAVDLTRFLDTAAALAAHLGNATRPNSSPDETVEGSR